MTRKIKCILGFHDWKPIEGKEEKKECGDCGAIQWNSFAFEKLVISTFAVIYDQLTSQSRRIDAIEQAQIGMLLMKTSKKTSKTSKRK